MKPLLTALLCLLISAAILTTAFLIHHLPSVEGASPKSKHWQGAEFQVARGKGTTIGDRIQIEPRPGEDAIALLSPRVDLTADAYHLFRYRIHGLWAGTRVSLLWPKPGNPGEQYQVPLTWSGDGTHRFGLQDVPVWKGRIPQFALLIAGEFNRPIVVDQLGFEPLTAWGLIHTVWTEWTAFEPWTQYSINLSKGGASARTLSPVLAAGVWAALALLLFLLWHLFRRQPAPAVATLLIIAVPWLLLDARWQMDLSRRLAETKAHYAGKPSDEKVLPEAGGEDLMALVNAAKGALDPKARVWIVTQGKLHRFYARYRLLPLSAAYTRGFKGKYYRNLGPGDGILLLGRSNADVARIAPRAIRAAGQTPPQTYAPEDLNQGPNPLEQDPTAPHGTAIVADGKNKWLHRGPEHQAPPQGYYQARFILQPPAEQPARVRLQVLQHAPEDGSTTVLAQRNVHLRQEGYHPYPLSFVVQRPGRLEYRVLHAPPGTRGAGVRLQGHSDPQELAFIGKNGNPPYAVVRLLATRPKFGMMLEIL